MESSTVLAFRIFVMLSCLIVVPMAAIFGSAFPEIVKTVLVDRIVAWGTGKTPEATKAAEPGFEAAAMGTSSAPANRNNWEAPKWGAPTTAASWPSQEANAAGAGVIPAGVAGANPAMGNQPASFAAPADPTRAVPASYPLQRPGGEAPQHSTIENAAPGTSALSYPGRPGALPTRDIRSGAEVPQPLEQPDRFTAMERRLREYGATYYLLETWGNDGELYRFHCKMAIGNNPNYTRHFEATDHDALKAMAQVLERVEAWRAGRIQ